MLAAWASTAWSSPSMTTSGCPTSWRTWPLGLCPCAFFRVWKSRPLKATSWFTACRRSTDVAPGIGLAELLTVVRGHEAAIVAAHPFRWDQPFDEIVERHGPVFDALELVSNNVTRTTRARTQAILDQHAMGATGSSDAHELATIGCYFTEFDQPIETMADFVAALRSRTGRPRHRDGVHLASGPVV